MPVHRGPVLLDANSVIEAHRVGAWDALAARYRIVMVQKCIDETQTGSQRREPEQTIDYELLLAALHERHPDDLVAIMGIQLIPGGSLLDEGETSLWAHALKRTDDWLICGPDAASMRFGFDRRKRDRLVSLGGLLADIGHRPARPLYRNYEKAWLDALIHNLVMGLL
ncbi:hypothetical protein QO001_006111 [Methylobacterium brachiatum]|uniref:Uncharacterized protein n=1 Tax=Methylobacterium brachiatum TaxID=269660 RepID=A0AAJ1X0A9_9HYPH|nr:hypothetical protein [Methylobacterium brachiatum]MCB4805882.1 hypothetical protein [Methylobacterium brachiatum]MDQ0547155.1 hypothetical protein [Methylobacterium brachiatum]